MRLTGEVLEALASASPDGHLLYLPRLGSALYQRADAVLQAAGGRWDRARQAHVFPGPAGTPSSR
jgi:hypothetical protein